MIDRTSYTISIVNNALHHQKKYIKTKIIDMRIIKVLVSLNLVYGLCKLNSGYLIKINIEMGRKFKIINWFRKHSKNYMSPTQITKLKLNHQPGLYIFSTPVGFVDQHKLIQKNAPGFLVFQVVLK